MVGKIKYPNFIHYNQFPKIYFVNLPQASLNCKTDRERKCTQNRKTFKVCELALPVNTQS